MAVRSTVAINNFSSGEISEELHARLTQVLAPSAASGPPSDHPSK